MDRSPAPPRLYGEKEVGKILKRATELQRDLPSRSSGSGGLSLQELEEIAAEAGIDPGYLRRAALELESGDLGITGWAQVVGDQLTLVREIVIPGEIPEADFEDIVAVIQETNHEHGQASVLGRTLTWHAETPSKSRSIQVVVAVRRGETRLRVEERLHQFAGGLFGGMLAGLGTGVGLGVGIPLAQVVGSALLGVLFPVGAMAVTFVGVREIYRSYVRKRRRVLDEVMGRLSEEIRACIEEAGSPSEETPTLPPSS